MWPFKKKPVPTVDPKTIRFTQVDVTERFGDNSTFTVDDWIETVPINTLVPDAEAGGLPGTGATEEEVYSAASRMSQIRESIDLPNDGVYCPLCHIANVDLSRLRTPCPKCGKPLLQFDWN
jgi:hypothetical protein